MDLTIEERENELLSIRSRQPYSIEMKGIKLDVDLDVFPPDFGLTTKYISEIVPEYSGKHALDMGCGSGYIALLMRKNGFNDVWAIDNHLPALECTKKNCLKNNCLDIKILESDLCKKIPAEVKYDFIVFNQPYYPSNGIFGLGEDGGRCIIERFLEEIKHFISPSSNILMPFSSFATEENSPYPLANKHGFQVSNIFNQEDRAGEHCIYKLNFINS